MPVYFPLSYSPFLQMGPTCHWQIISPYFLLCLVSSSCSLVEPLATDDDLARPDAQSVSRPDLPASRRGGRDPRARPGGRFLVCDTAPPAAHGRAPLLGAAAASWCVLPPKYALPLPPGARSTRPLTSVQEWSPRRRSGASRRPTLMRAVSRPARGTCARGETDVRW
jgi:hypothetical protein